MTIFSAVDCFKIYNRIEITRISKFAEIHDIFGGRNKYTIPVA